MVKTNIPFLSLGAHGTVGKAITAQKRHGFTLIRKTPIPTDPQSLAQMYQRWLYQDYIALWHTLSDADKATYHTLGTRYRLPAFAYFVRTYLNSLSDIAVRYHLDEDGGLIAHDAGPNAQPLTVFGASPATGRIHLARLFDGLDDYLQRVPAPPTDINGHTYSIQAWVNTTAARRSRVIDKHWGTGVGEYFMETQANGKIRYGTWGSLASFVKDSIATINDGHWHLITMTQDPTGWQILIDNTLDSSGADTPGILTCNGPFSLGKYHGGVLPFYLGDIDEATVYLRVLTLIQHKIQYQRRYPL